MGDDTQQLDWKSMLADAGPYPIEAFHFVREGLSYTAERVHEQPETLPEVDRHISGQQLCLGLRDFAIDRYGLLAPTVLRHWRIDRTDDFGRIVFSMIEHGLMSKTDEDTLEDFRAVYDFDEAFSREELLSRITTG
ncbi:MAG: Minf_1886 family protein [Planctomycetota bacterium]|jgi:uncharacterized repeat protein (TIGR04138 family)